MPAAGTIDEASVVFASTWVVQKPINPNSMRMKIFLTFYVLKQVG